MNITNIYRCERAAGEHRGRWIIQTYHAMSHTNYMAEKEARIERFAAFANRA